MQALSMIDMGAKAPETVAPAKPAELQSKQFGNVLEKQRQPEQAQQVEMRQQPEARQKPTEKQAVVKTGRSVVVDEQPLAKEAFHVEPEIRQIVGKLLNQIAGRESAETAGKGASVEELLNQLAKKLNTSELQGEQVLAGIDLSALVEQLQELSELQVNPEYQENIDIQHEDGPLKQLVSHLAAQLASETQPQATAPAPVTMEQATGLQPVAELQNTIDSVKGQKPFAQPVRQPVEGDEQPEEPELLVNDEQSEEIDPRFAGFLKPRSEKWQPQQSLREQVQAGSARMSQEQLKQSGTTGQQMSEMNVEQSQGAELSEQIFRSPKQVFENLVSQIQGQSQPANATPHQGITGKLMPDSPMVQLPGGQQVAESQIFDQVVARFSGSFNGESGRMVLRMKPAELGSLKIELMVEGDRIRANLQAQSLQVQDVLERNLPQLRNALAEQGLKIDQFQVNVNQEQSQQSLFDQLAQEQHQRNGAQAKQHLQLQQEPEEQIIPLAHLMQNGGGGISLHV